MREAPESSADMSDLSHQDLVDTPGGFHQNQNLRRREDDGYNGRFQPARDHDMTEVLEGRDRGRAGTAWTAAGSPVATPHKDEPARSPETPWTAQSGPSRQRPTHDGPVHVGSGAPLFAGTHDGIAAVPASSAGRQYQAEKKLASSREDARPGSSLYSDPAMYNTYENACRHADSVAQADKLKPRSTFGPRPATVRKEVTQAPRPRQNARASPPPNNRGVVSNDYRVMAREPSNGTTSPPRLLEARHGTARGGFLGPERTSPLRGSPLGPGRRGAQRTDRSSSPATRTPVGYAQARPHVPTLALDKFNARSESTPQLVPASPSPSASTQSSTQVRHERHSLGGPLDRAKLEHEASMPIAQFRGSGQLSRLMPSASVGQLSARAPGVASPGGRHPAASPVRVPLQSPGRISPGRGSFGRPSASPGRDVARNALSGVLGQRQQYAHAIVQPYDPRVQQQPMPIYEPKHRRKDGSDSGSTPLGTPQADARPSGPPPEPEFAVRQKPPRDHYGGGRAGPGRAVAVSRTLIAVAIDGGRVVLWGLPQNQTVDVVIKAHEDEVECLATSGEWLLTHSRDKTLLWDLPLLGRRVSRSQPNRKGVADGKPYFQVGHDLEVSLEHDPPFAVLLKKDEPLPSWPDGRPKRGPRYAGETATACCLSRDASRVCVADSCVRVWAISRTLNSPRLSEDQVPLLAVVALPAKCTAVQVSPSRVTCWCDKLLVEAKLPGERRAPPPPDGDRLRVQRLPQAVEVAHSVLPLKHGVQACDKGFVAAQGDIFYYDESRETLDRLELRRVGRDSRAPEDVKALAADDSGRVVAVLELGAVVTSRFDEQRGRWTELKCLREPPEDTSVGGGASPQPPPPLRHAAIAYDAEKRTFRITWRRSRDHHGGSSAKWEDLTISAEPG